MDRRYFSIDEDCIKNYNEESDKGYFLEVDVQYTKKVHEPHNDLLFLPQKIMIEETEKLVANLPDHTKYVIHRKILKQALKSRTSFEKSSRLIKFNQNTWLKPYIDMSTDQRKKAKNYFKKDLFKLINNVVFGKKKGKCEKT